MEMHWPQITMIVLLSLGAGMHIMKHGEPRTEKYNMFYQFVGIGITVTLLYFGGFFGKVM
jgi:hypothetical protein